MIIQYDDGDGNDDANNNNQAVNINLFSLQIKEQDKQVRSGRPSN